MELQELIAAEPLVKDKSFQDLFNKTDRLSAWFTKAQAMSSKVWVSKANLNVSG